MLVSFAAGFTSVHSLHILLKKEMVFVVCVALDRWHRNLQTGRNSFNDEWCVSELSVLQK